MSEYQEIFIVFREKKYESETTSVLAVFDTEDLANSYIAKKRENEYFRQNYTYYVIDQELRTELSE